RHDLVTGVQTCTLPLSARIGTTTPPMISIPSSDCMVERSRRGRISCSDQVEGLQPTPIDLELSQLCDASLNAGDALARIRNAGRRVARLRNGRRGQRIRVNKLPNQTDVNRVYEEETPPHRPDRIES